MKKKLRVAVLSGGKSPEYEVSCSSGKMVSEALEKRGHKALPLVITKEGRGYEDLFDSKVDVVFIAMHGPFGEDGTVQGLLELAGIPYTGSGVLASALGMDKLAFRQAIMGTGVLVPKYLVLEKGDRVDKVWKNFQLPVVVKPSSQGSSVGVSIVRAKKDLKKALEKAFDFGPRVIVEEFLSGTEVTCGILGNEKPIALPVAEIVPKKEFFDYEAKYTPGMSEEIVPAQISPGLTSKVKETALKVYRAVSCLGFGRVDMIICQGKPYVLEINTIPGLTPNSLLPKEAAVAGIAYPELIEKVVEFALQKNVPQIK